MLKGLVKNIRIIYFFIKRCRILIDIKSRKKEKVKKKRYKKR